jgi:hypothetical protein
VSQLGTPLGLRDGWVRRPPRPAALLEDSVSGVVPALLEDALPRWLTVPLFVVAAALLALVVLGGDLVPGRTQERGP